MDISDLINLQIKNKKKEEKNITQNGKFYKLDFKENEINELHKQVCILCKRFFSNFSQNMNDYLPFLHPDDEEYVEIREKSQVKFSELVEKDIKPYCEKKNYDLKIYIDTMRKINSTYINDNRLQEFRRQLDAISEPVTTALEERFLTLSSSINNASMFAKNNILTNDNLKYLQRICNTLASFLNTYNCINMSEFLFRDMYQNIINDFLSLYTNDNPA